jgi:hypothetical protein
MIQQGQVFKLKAKGADGQALWAYPYRLEGRGSARPQLGGFATRAEALKALGKVLEWLGPNGRAATMTLSELVDEYLEMHQAEPVTICKLRWLLAKATAAPRAGGALPGAPRSDKSPGGELLHAAGSEGAGAALAGSRRCLYRAARLPARRPPRLARCRLGCPGQRSRYERRFRLE